MEYIKIRNWDKWQTYRKDRGQPPWIKVHRCVMRNPDWVSLTDAERGQLVAIWLLAADRDGVIPASPAMIQKLCFMDTEPDLEKFQQLQFLECNDANVTPCGCQDDANVTNQKQKQRQSREDNKVQGCALPSEEELKESSIPKIKSDITNLTEKIYQKKLFPKVNAFVNYMKKHQKNDRAILHVLSRIYLKGTNGGFTKEGDAWAYGVKVMNVENGNYNESDHIKAS